MDGRRLTRDDLDLAFRALGEAAVAAGRIVEIAVYGGAALVLTFPGRAATKDVDAVFLTEAAWLRSAVADVADAQGWPRDWLNDAVKGWLSHRDGETDVRPLMRTYPSEAVPGLRVFLAGPHYLFAMKCLAMRIAGADETQDRSDILILAEAIGIRSVEHALDLVSSYYPSSAVPPKTRFGIEELFGRPENGT